MMTIEQALELIEAIEHYGDLERVYGLSDGAGHSPQAQAERDRLAAEALNDVRRMLRPHIEDPDHEYLNDQYLVPDLPEETWRD